MPDIKALLHLASNILHFFFAVANAVMYEGETFVASFVDIITTTLVRRTVLYNWGKSVILGSRTMFA